MSFVECVECLCGVLHITTIHQNINLLNLLSQASFSRTLSVNNMAARLQYSIDYLLFLRDNMALHICPLENFSPNAFLCDLVQLNGRDQNHALERERVLRTTSLRYAPPSARQCWSVFASKAVNSESAPTAAKDCFRHAGTSATAFSTGDDASQREDPSLANGKF